MTEMDEIKDQFARFLIQRDWIVFKTMGEYYLRTAASLKKKDINIPEYGKLWMRNSVKRLFIGIGCELLLKSFYLKNGFCINKPKSNGISKVPTHKIRDIDREDFNDRATYTFGTLLDHLKNVSHFRNQDQIHKGFTIAMIFRNKEGHSTFARHDFEAQNYTDIETATTLFYEEAFKEILDFQISMEPNEPARFKIRIRDG